MTTHWSDAAPPPDPAPLCLIAMQHMIILIAVPSLFLCVADNNPSTTIIH